MVTCCDVFPSLCSFFLLFLKFELDCCLPFGADEFGEIVSFYFC